MSIFIKYPAAAGECADSGHAGWLDARQIQWGIQRNITSNASTRGDRESANAETSHLIIRRKMDKATPALILDACCGKGREVVIHLTKTGAGSGSEPYMEYVLKNALISDYQVYVLAQDNSRPAEKLTISFTEMEVRYTPYDDDGNAEAPVSVGYDTTTNKRY